MCIALYPFLTPDSVSHASLSCIYKGMGYEIHTRQRAAWNVRMRVYSIAVDSTITYGSARREISLSLDRIRTSLDHLS